MKILITGGSRLIGARLADDLLEQNCDAKVFNKATSKIYSELV